MIVLESVLPFLGILLALVILHELGHFTVAKLAGVRVEEFGLGLPPRIGGFRFGETLYSINWLPLGGFVRLTGEESARLFVTTVNPAGAGARAGLRPGDVVLAVNGVPVHSDEVFARRLILAADGEPIELTIDRERRVERGAVLEQQTISLRPDAPTAFWPPPGRPAAWAAEIGGLAGIQVQNDPRSLATKPRPIRIAVLAMGAGVNAVLPIILFAIAAMIPQPVAEGPALISTVTAGSPADQAGLQAGDRFLSIDGKTVRNAADVGLQIQLNLGRDIEIVVERDIVDPTGSRRSAGTREIIATTVHERLAPAPLEHVVQPGETILDIADRLGVTPAQVVAGAGYSEGYPLPESITLLLPGGEEYVTKKGDTAEAVARDLGFRTQIILDAAGIDPLRLPTGTLIQIPQGPTGISIANAKFTTVDRSDGFFAAFATGWGRTIDTLELMRNRIRAWVAGGEGIRFSGPIGIAQATGEVVEEAGWLRLIELAALISLNLAIINILPLPMLDGGRIFFVLVEILRRGRRISPEKEGLVHLAGFVLLITFVIAVSYFDIVRVVSGESALR